MNLLTEVPKEVRWEDERDGWFMSVPVAPDASWAYSLRASVERTGNGYLIWASMKETLIPWCKVDEMKDVVETLWRLGKL